MIITPGTIQSTRRLDNRQCPQCDGDIYWEHLPEAAGSDSGTYEYCVNADYTKTLTRQYP